MSRFQKLRDENPEKYADLVDEDIENEVHQLDVVSTEALFNQLQKRGYSVTLSTSRGWS